MSISVGQVTGNPKEAAELIAVLESEIAALTIAANHHHEEYAAQQAELEQTNEAHGVLVEECARLRAALGEIGYHAEGPYDETDAKELAEWLKSIHEIATGAVRLNQQSMTRRPQHGDAP